MIGHYCAKAIVEGTLKLKELWDRHEGVGKGRGKRKPESSKGSPVCPV